MKRLIVLSMVLIALLVGCSSEPEKTFQNPAEVIKALDKHNVTECNDLDAEPFLANKSVICFIELGGGELKDVMFNISTYADIKQIDLFKDKCKKNDVGVFPASIIFLKKDAPCRACRIIGTLGLEKCRVPRLDNKLAFRWGFLFPHFPPFPFHQRTFFGSRVLLVLGRPFRDR